MIKALDFLALCLVSMAAYGYLLSHRRHSPGRRHLKHAGSPDPLP
jgi:hypothetical protein